MLLEYLSKKQIDLKGIEKYIDPKSGHHVIIRFDLQTDNDKFPYFLWLKNYKGEIKYEQLFHGKKDNGHPLDEDEIIYQYPCCKGSCYKNCKGYTKENFNETYNLLLEKIKEKIERNPKYRLRFLYL